MCKPILVPLDGTVFCLALARSFDTVATASGAVFLFEWKSVFRPMRERVSHCMMMFASACQTRQSTEIS